MWSTTSGCSLIRWRIGTSSRAKAAAPTQPAARPLRRRATVSCVLHKRFCLQGSSCSGNPDQMIRYLLQHHHSGCSPCQAESRADRHKVPVLGADRRSDLPTDSIYQIVEQRAKGGGDSCGSYHCCLHVAAVPAHQGGLYGAGRWCGCCAHRQESVTDSFRFACGRSWGREGGDGWWTDSVVGLASAPLSSIAGRDILSMVWYVGIEPSSAIGCTSRQSADHSQAFSSASSRHPAPNPAVPSGPAAAALHMPCHGSLASAWCLFVSHTRPRCLQSLSC